MQRRSRPLQTSVLRSRPRGTRSFRGEFSQCSVTTVAVRFQSVQARNCSGLTTTLLKQLWGWVSRDKELAAVKLKKEDIELIMKEYEVERKLADRRLREHSGNLRAALESFL